MNDENALFRVLRQNILMKVAAEVKIQYFSQDGILKTASLRRKGHSVLMWQKVRRQRSHHKSPSNLFTRADPSRPETLTVASLTNVLS